MPSIFKDRAFNDLQHWIKTDPRLAFKIMKMITETSRDPFGGTGKPEPLKGDFSGFWSKRINQEHRMIYKKKGDDILIYRLKGHYDDK